MKYFFQPLCVSLFILVSAICYAQDIKEIGHLEFADTLFNFHAVKEEDGILSHSFQFVNLGPEQFFIEDIDPSCGCITPEYPMDTIHPGGQGKITLYFDPVNHPGLFERKIAVKGNASRNPVYLYIKGYVTPSPQPIKEWERTSSFKYGNICLQKNYANFGTVSNKEIYQLEISVYNNGNAAISLATDDVKLPAYIKASLVPLKLEPKEKGMLKIMFHPKLVNRMGYFAEQAEISFVVNNQKVAVPVVLSAFVKEGFTAAESASVSAPKIYVEKMQVDMGTVKTDDKTSAEITVMNSGMSELIIRGIRTSSSSVEAFAEKTSLKPGASTKIRVVFDTTEKMGQESKFITVFSNDPVHSISVITIKANVVEELQVVPQGQ